MSEKACPVGSPSKFKPKIYHRAAAVQPREVAQDTMSDAGLSCLLCVLEEIRMLGPAKGAGSWAPPAATHSGVFLQCCKQLRMGPSRETTECVFSLPQKDQTHSEGGVGNIFCELGGNRILAIVKISGLIFS